MKGLAVVRGLQEDRLILYAECLRPSLIPRPEEEEKGPGFSRSCMHLIAVEFHHITIDILLYAHDARIDTKCNTVRRFMIARYGMQETHSIVLIQRPI